MKPVRSAANQVSILLLGALLTSGCATLAGRSETLSIDSETRGTIVKVPEAGDDVQKRTPFFMKLGRAQQHTFTLQSGTTSQEMKLPCRFRWVPTLVGNLPLTLLGSLTNPLGMLLPYGVGLGIDLVSGAAWQCDSRIVLQNPAEQTHAQVLEEPSQPQPCDALAFIAVNVKDSATALAYEEAWRQYRGKNTSRCEKLINHDKCDGALSRHGLQIVDANALHNRLSKQGLKVAFEAGATHFLLVSTEEVNSILNFHAEKVDAHTLRTVETIDWVQALPSGYSSDQKSLWQKSIPQLLGLVPNSLGLTTGQIKFWTPHGESTSTIAQNQHLTGLILTRVQHPDQYSPWDMAFDWFPDGSLQYITLTETASPFSKTKLEKPDYRAARAINASSNLSGQVTAHTPIGAISFHGGLGALALVTRRDGERAWTPSIAPYFTAGLIFRAFPHERIFVQAEFQKTSPLTKSLTLGERRISGVTTTSFGIGTYLPEGGLWLGRHLN